MLEKIFSFIRTYLPIIGAGVIGYYIFKWQSSLPDPNSFNGRLLEHLGVAFWVTGMAIIFYEYGAKEKRVLESLDKLNKLIETQAKEKLDICFDLLFRDDRKESPVHLKDTSKNFKKLVNDILELQQKNIWAKEKYIGFLNYLLAEVVLRNANNLVEIGGIGSKSFHVPPAEEMADRILAAQMSAMEKGNTYDVISDLGSWQNNQLTYFSDQTRERVGKGVKVRRIFNLLRLDRSLDRMVTHYRDDSKINDIRGILEKHLKDSIDWGTHDVVPKYEVKILRKQELKISEKRKYLEEADIHKKHFGLFNHGDGIVKFTVAKPNLSDMALSADPARIDDDLGVFNAVWAHAAIHLTQDLIEDIIRDLEQQVKDRRASDVDSPAKLQTKDVQSPLLPAEKSDKR